LTPLAALRRTDVGLSLWPANLGARHFAEVIGTPALEFTGAETYAK